MSIEHSRKYMLLLLAVFFILAGFILHNGDISYSLVHLMNQVLSAGLSDNFWAIGFGYVSTILLYTGTGFFIFYLFKSGKINEKQSFLVCIFLFIIHYFYYLQKNSFNYPIYDDQGAVLEFLNRFTDAQSAGEKLKLIFNPFWESRMAVPRFFVVVLWKIFGEINFQYLTLLNGILLMSFHFFLLNHFLPKNPDRLYYVLALTLLAFQFQAYNTIFCCIAALPYYGVLLFASLSFHFLHTNEPGKKYLSLIFAVAAALTFGNGALIFPLALIYMWNQKRIREFGSWVVVFLIFSMINILDRGSFESNSGIGFHLLNWFLFSSAFLGSSFQFLYTIHLPVIVGLMVFLVLIAGVFKKWYVSSPVIFMMLAFLVLSVITAAPFRSDINAGGEYALQVRYGTFSIYSVILALMLVIGNVTWRFRKRKLLIVVLALTYNLLTGLFFYPEVALRKQKINGILKELKVQKFSTEYSIYKQKELEVLMKESIEKGIYKPR